MTGAKDHTPPAPHPQRSQEKGTGAPPGTNDARTCTPPLPSEKGAGGAGRLKLAAALIAVLLVGVGLCVALRGPRDDIGRLQGEWRLTTADRGAQLPTLVRVTGDRWVYVVGGAEQKRYAVTLRPEAKEIDLTQLAAEGVPLTEMRGGEFVPVVHRGVYALDGDRVRFATAPPAYPRPTSLDGTDGAPVWVLERR
ncbi:MAG: hypothetical protein ACKODX_21120 [Gemmata sp.]